MVGVPPFDGEDKSFLQRLLECGVASPPIVALLMP